MTLNGDTTIDITEGEVVELENITVIQNIGNSTILYSKEPFSETNKGFRLGGNDVLILSAPANLYVTMLGDYGTGHIQATNTTY